MRESTEHVVFIFVCVCVQISHLHLLDLVTEMVWVPATEVCVCAHVVWKCTTADVGLELTCTLGEA